MKTQSVVSTLKKEQGKGRRLGFFMFHLACVGMALCVFVLAGCAEGGWHPADYTLRQKKEAVLPNLPHGYSYNFWTDGHTTVESTAQTERHEDKWRVGKLRNWIGAASTEPDARYYGNKWTVTGAEVGVALKERDRIISDRLDRWIARLPEAARNYKLADRHYWQLWYEAGFSPQFAWKNTDPYQTHTFSRPLLKGEKPD